MSTIVIKSQYQETAIAFGNSGLPLNKRPQSDLIDLGIMTHRSGNPELLKLFETLPSLQELQDMKMGKVVATVKAKPINRKKADKK